jgi:hypothetical protein
MGGNELIESTNICGIVISEFTQPWSSINPALVTNPQTTF